MKELVIKALSIYDIFSTIGRKRYSVGRAPIKEFGRDRLKIIEIQSRSKAKLSLTKYSRSQNSRNHFEIQITGLLKPSIKLYKL